MAAAFGLSVASVASETLPLQRLVEGQTIVSKSDPPITIQVSESFKYAGGQRFILRQVADAEQHFFVDVDEKKTIRRMYWIQFEHLLPGHDGAYSYEKDQPMLLGDRGFRVHVRRVTDAPASDSDRARVYQYLEQAGYLVPIPATRVRLVYVPEADPRQEVMIIYAEASGATGEPTPEEVASITERAKAGLTLAPR